MLKAECLQSWLLGAPEGISTHVKPGWSDCVRYSQLGETWQARDILGRGLRSGLQSRDSQEGACHQADRYHWPWYPLRPLCPQGQVTCFVISFSFPLGPQIFLSLCIRKTDSGLRWFQLLVTKTESWCLSLQVIFCKGIFFFFFCIPNPEP